MKIEDLKKIAEARTKGPWFPIKNAYEWWSVRNNSAERICEMPHAGNHSDEQQNAKAIATFENHIDELLAVVEAAKTAIFEVATTVDVDSYVENPNPREWTIETAVSTVLNISTIKKLKAALKNLESK